VLKKRQEHETKTETEGGWLGLSQAGKEACAQEVIQGRLGQDYGKIEDELERQTSTCSSLGCAAMGNLEGKNNIAGWFGDPPSSA